MDAARRELCVRALALPGALIVARIATVMSRGAVRMISMWVHESGHAASAWFTGFTAFPGPWVTPIGAERSPMVTLVLVGALAVGAYFAWQAARWFWVVSASLMAVLALAGACLVHPIRARELFTFF